MFKELFGDKLESKNGEVETETALANLDAIMIYFSAHCSAPCQGFTPVFATKYQKLKDAGKKFEVVFASSDSDQATFTSCYDEMPWLALPYDKRELNKTLAKKFKQDGKPYLVVLNGTDLEIITPYGKEGVSAPTFIEDFPWGRKPMYDISEGIEGIILGGEVFILVQNYSEADVKAKNSAMLLDLAKNDSKLFDKFFTMNSGGEFIFIRKELSLPVQLEEHVHPLTESDNTGETKNEWACDGCSQNGKNFDKRHRCKGCDFDFCANCLEQCKNPISDALKVPRFVILDLQNGCYYKPLEGKTEITKENIMAFSKDKADDKLTKETLTSRIEPEGG